MTLQEALRKAEQESIDEGCSRHVKKARTGNYYIISDWYDDSVVASFDRGTRIN